MTLWTLFSDIHTRGARCPSPARSRATPASTASRARIDRGAARGGGAVDAYAGFFGHPATGLCVQIRQITEDANRQEVAFKIFNTRLDDAFLSRIRRRTRNQS